MLFFGVSEATWILMSIFDDFCRKSSTLPLSSYTQRQSSGSMSVRRLITPARSEEAFSTSASAFFRLFAIMADVFSGVSRRKT